MSDTDLKTDNIKKGLILIVDDENINRVLLSTNLKKVGYDILLANDGKQAFKVIAQKRPELILLDLVMPEMDGFQVLERLKTDPDLRSIPVIIISAANEMDDVVKCVELGAIDHLSKPFEPVLLQARIKSCFDRIYWENLEEEMNRKRINDALEEGRAQLSAMILHNIGNAITPVLVQLDQLKANNDSRIMGYLNKCYSELQQNAEKLTEFVTADPKGAEIFAFLGKLITALEDQKVHFKATLNHISEATEYVSEIISLQQNYAAGSKDIKEWTDLNQLIRDALKMQAVAIDERHISIEQDLSENLPMVLIDKTKLMQVIINLIKNAYEAMEKVENDSAEKKIIFRTYQHDNQVGFEIEDNGIGVNREQIEAILKYGQSGKGSTGFGLYYCKMFVEANSGQLDFISQRTGGGSIVRILIPKE